jgi:hypothetical protein
MLRIFILILFVLSMDVAEVLAADKQRPSEPSPSKKAEWESYQKSSDPADVLVKKCSTEAGIPPNDPKHAITTEEMRRLTACIDRNR